MEKITNLQLTFLTFIIVVLNSGFLGLHSRFNIRVNKCHSNLCHFINCLKQEVYFPHQVTQMRADATGRLETKTTNSVQHRINTLADHYKNNQINLEEYLEDL